MHGANVSTEVYMKEVVKLKEEIEELLGDNKQLLNFIVFFKVYGHADLSLHAKIGELIEEMQPESLDWKDALSQIESVLGCGTGSPSRAASLPTRESSLTDIGSPVLGDEGLDAADRGAGGIVR